MEADVNKQWTLLFLCVTALQALWLGQPFLPLCKQLCSVLQQNRTEPPPPDVSLL